LLQDGLEGLVFRERELASPYIKCYGEPDEAITWPELFDTSNWVLFFIKEGGKPVGGLTIACQNSEIIENRILKGIDDLAVVWDIRVHPDHRRQGFGTKLFGKAIEWSKNKGYKQLSVETQNTNVPACRFYIKQGCRLGGINRYAYYHNPSYADEAQAVVEAFDGEAISCGNPDAVKVVSFGGQNPDNEKMVMTLRSWFNAMAGNPEQLAGTRGSTQTGTATEFTGLQSNAAVGLQDMRDIVYDVAADISKKESWYIHTDPLIKMPLTKRVTGDTEIQIWLTPEQRQGDWAELTFEIVKRSMNVVEPHLRAKRIIEFYTNVLPAIAVTAMQNMQLGIPFNVQRAVMQAAEELGIEDAISEVFNDPTFQQRMELFMQMGPKDAGKGQIISPKGVAQNEGFPMKRNILTPGQDFNQQSQMGAADMQSVMKGAF